MVLCMLLHCIECDAGSFLVVRFLLRVSIVRHDSTSKINMESGLVKDLRSQDSDIKEIRRIIEEDWWMKLNAIHVDLGFNDVWPSSGFP